MKEIGKNDGLLFMKVGLHAQETIEEIIERKKRELKEAGVCFWGYGGNSCHPVTRVQPFAKEVEETGGRLKMVMHKMNSNHMAEPKLAQEYSDDGINYKPIPEGVEVRGSRFALVLADMEESEFDLSLRDLQVVMGNRRGVSASEFIRGQNDKGCFAYRETGEVPQDGDIKRIDLISTLAAPYAVFLK